MTKRMLLNILYIRIIVSCQTNDIFVAPSSRRCAPIAQRAGAGYSLGILLSVREAEARVLHVPHCGRDSAGIAPYIALTVLFCPGCALKNNAVQPRPVRRLELRRVVREPRVCDLKISFNFSRVFVAPSRRKRDSGFCVLPSLDPVLHCPRGSFSIVARTISIFRSWSI